MKTRGQPCGPSHPELQVNGNFMETSIKIKNILGIMLGYEYIVIHVKSNFMIISFSSDHHL